jgi:hypothetical protein
VPLATRTVYSRVGDMFAVLCTAAAALGLIRRAAPRQGVIPLADRR